MIASLAAPMLAGLVFVSSGPALPRVDIQRACAQSATGAAPRSCISDETYARKKLLKYWDRTPLKFKMQCISAAEPPSPSYMVLRDCINNARMVRQIQKRP